MRKLTMLSALLCTSILGLAQSSSENKASPDTTFKRDSLIEEIKENVLDNIPVISLDDNDLSEGSSQNISSQLTAGRDPFYSAASFNFNAARFRIRGYESDLFGTYMNGIPMDNLDNGFTPYGLWGGLNDVMRNRDVSQGLRYNTFAFGEIGGVTNVDSRASKQRKQTSFSYALSNRNYVHRLMISHSTGINKKGWAFSFSGSRRWANEGYVPGTYYDGWSYFIGVDKRLNQKNLFSIVAFGAPTENGRQGAAVTEIQELANTHYYNPYWGYQNGKKRNANVGKTNQPVIIITHDLRLSNKTSLISAIGYSFGNKSTTGLDWYNAPDPRPDYYRYLPGFYIADADQYSQLQKLMKENESYRQVNWQHLYDVNRDSHETIHNADGITGNDVTGKRSHYVITERVVNTQRINFNSVFNTRLNEHFDLTAGFTYQSQKNNYYQKLNDLLGGEFYVDLNQFAERDFPNNSSANQNDLNHPNRILYTGDKYGYNYDININRTAFWLQTVIKYSKVDIFFATEISYTQFWRTGNVKNGLFPEHSFGKSQVNEFYNHAVKAGITYKLNGRNYFYANGSWLTRAPYFENAYISPRTRDLEQQGLTSETINSAEAGYTLNAPKLKIRLSGYYTTFKDGFNVLTFYDDTYRNFVNYALSNINKVHFGGEFGMEAKLMPNVTVSAAAAVGRYYYDSRQNTVITLDNSSEILANETVYSDNYRIASTPQEAYSLGFTYRSPKFWFLSLTGNYFDKMWLEFNPVRRTYSATEGVDYKSPLWYNIIRQTEFDPQYTVDFFGGYSYKLPKSWGFKKPVYFVLNAGINNILNNKNIITGGYEQLRFDYVDKNVNKFPPKLYYAYGLNYFINATIRF